MSNYTKTTDFEAKDSLPSGDNDKIIKGAEFETEFDAISTAIATKADTAGPTFTGTATFATTNATTVQIGGVAITSTAAELNTLDGITSTTAELNTLDGFTGTVDDLNYAKDLRASGVTGDEFDILDGLTATAAELNILDGATLSTAELNLLDGVTATTAELNILDGVTSTGIELNILDGVTATTAELNLLDGITATTTELNYVDGVTSSIQSQIDTKSPIASPTFTGTVTIPTADINGGAVDGVVIGGTTAAAGSFTTVSATGNITVDGTVDGRDVATDGTKLDGIEASATADQTDAEIRAAVEAATDSNVFTDADHTKLDGIEALADVTDTTNVTAAGALMDSELTNLTAVKSLDQGVATTDTPTFAGLTTTADVSFGDNDKAIFGAGSDLQIYHDGSNSIINEGGTGDLEVQANRFVVQSASGVDDFLIVTPSAGVDLRHNVSGTVGTKLATTSTGIDVTGTVTADGLTLQASEDVVSWASGNGIVQAPSNLYVRSSGTGDVLLQSDSTAVAKFEHGGDISFYEDTGTTAKFYWDASKESLGIGQEPTSALHVINSTASGESIATLEAASTKNGYIYINGDDNRRKSLVFQSGGVDKFSMGVGDSDELSQNSFFIGSGKTGGSGADLVIDSNGQVGIGTSSPDTLLHLSDTLGGAVLRLERNDTAIVATDQYGAIEFEGQDANAGASGVRASMRAVAEASVGQTSLTFSTAGSGASEAERMRIDSSGNLLVGTTSSSSSTAGIKLTAAGTATFVRDGVQPVYINRLTSDGDLTVFAKDGTSVGSIGTSSADGFYIHSTFGNDSGLVFGSERIVPCTSTGVFEDGVQDLGYSSGRFKDLYLSGGAYLGGTGSANKLDDYEEGTFTATFDFSTSSSGALTYNRQTGRYIKIGNVVYISLWLSWTANNFTASTGALVLTGLPFTQTSAQAERGGLYIAYTDTPFTGLTIYQQAFRVEAGSTNMTFNFSNGTDGSMSSSLTSYTQLTSSGSLMISGSYHVD